MDRGAAFKAAIRFMKHPLAKAPHAPHQTDSTSTFSPSTKPCTCCVLTLPHQELASARRMRHDVNLVFLSCSLRAGLSPPSLWRRRNKQLCLPRAAREALRVPRLRAAMVAPLRLPRLQAAERLARASQHPAAARPFPRARAQRPGRAVTPVVVRRPTGQRARGSSATVYVRAERGHCEGVERVRVVALGGLAEAKPEGGGERMDGISPHSTKK